MNAAPKPLIAFNAAGVPAGLRKINRWAPWHAAWNEKRGKYDKIPRYPNQIDVGLSNKKPHLWVSYDVALASLARNPHAVAGLGYCITDPHGIVGVDLDHCVAGDVIAPWAQDIIRELNSYTEISPSGTGLRIMGLGSIPHDWTNHEVGIEVYGGNDARFLTITGVWLEGTPDDLKRFDPAALEQLAKSYAKERRKADVIDIAMPEMLPDFVLPDVESLPIPDKCMRFMLEGDAGDDRSGTLHATGVSLYAAGFDDDMVFSVLASNPHAFEVALDHRRQDTDRALMYLWREHCVKAKPKGLASIPNADEFDALPALPETQTMPKFARDKSGRIEPTVTNTVEAVRRADLVGVQVAYDAFRDEITVAQPGTELQWRPMNDADAVTIRMGLEAVGFKSAPKELARDACVKVAAENTYDSAVLWLQSLKWDGKRRVETFLIDRMGCEDTPYTRAVALYMWSALAGRVLSPGVKADMVPIYEGDQGLRKSSSIEAISPAPEFFVEVDLDKDEDDTVRSLRGVLVGEIAELSGLHTRQLEWIKKFVVRKTEKWVPKYKEFATTFARRLLFIGTTNRTDILADETGNRRWLPLHITRADVDGIVADRDQLWAEGAALFAKHGVIWHDAERLALDQHDDYTIEDAWESEISKWLSTPGDFDGVHECNGGRPFTTSDVLSGALRIDAKGQDRLAQKRVSAILRAFGYSQKTTRIDGRPTRAWRNASFDACDASCDAQSVTDLV